MVEDIVLDAHRSYQTEITVKNEDKPSEVVEEKVIENDNYSNKEDSLVDKEKEEITQEDIKKEPLSSDDQTLIKEDISIDDTNTKINQDIEKPVQNPQSTTILLLPLIIFSLIAPCYYDLKSSEWFLLDVFYAILIILYHGNGIYGLGMRGISLDGSSLQFSMQFLIISLCIITVILFMIQIIMKWLNRIIRK